MRTGELKQRVKVIKYNLVADNAGGQTATEEELLQTWAKITPMRGARALQYGQIVQSTWYDVTMRHRSDIEVSKNISLEYNGKELVIHSVINKDFESKVFELAAYEKL